MLRGAWPSSRTAIGSGHPARSSAVEKLFRSEWKVFPSGSGLPSSSFTVFASLPKRTERLAAVMVFGTTTASRAGVGG